MSGQLDNEGRKLVRALREAGVLQDVNDHLLDQREGVILVSCADGDRFPDIFHRQERMQAGQRAQSRIHPLTCHGGALAYAPRSPVNRRKNADAIFLDQITDARVLKGIDVVALYAHTPCGAANQARIGLEKQIALQMRAKCKIKTLNAGIVVAPFFHVDYCNGMQRTYFLSRAHWEEWAREKCVQAIA